MPEEEFIKLDRESLYREIWEISASGVARKYNIQYGDLLRICKEIEIPIPPSGYWTKLSFGKSVDKAILSESKVNEITIPINVQPKRRKKSESTESTRELITVTMENCLQDEDPAERSDLESDNLPKSYISRQIIYSKSNERNYYNREKLYEEVWTNPVVVVATQYGVSDVAIHKVCKTLNVPVPPRGYWARVRAGEKLEKTPLPETDSMTKKNGSRTFNEVIETETTFLIFMEESDRDKVFLAAQQMKMPEENAKIHKKILSYKSVVKQWNEKNERPKGAQKNFSSYGYNNHPPFLAGVISNEALPRVYRILDALFNQVEQLGGSVNEDLSINVRHEKLHIEILEMQDEGKHQLTKDEAKQLVKYEDEKKHSSWASKPQIRKYDYIFNGRLRVKICENKYFRDKDNFNIEIKLGEMLIDIYEESEVIKLKREANEEAQRKAEEEKRLREERKNRYNEEVDKTTALSNMAQDYDIACKIRAFANALEPRADKEDEYTIKYIEWAKNKADWYDPTVVREDEFFGKRKHENDSDLKTLRKAGNYWSKF